MNAWPPTLEDAIRDKLTVILKAAADLGTEARSAEAEDRFRTSASAGAYRYVDQLRTGLERKELAASGEMLAEVSLVANAVHCAGWLSEAFFTGAGPTVRAGLRRLVNQGFFLFYGKVPGRYVACYRLVDPLAPAPSPDMS